MKRSINCAQHFGRPNLPVLLLISLLCITSGDLSAQWTKINTSRQAPEQITVSDLDQWVYAVVPQLTMGGSAIKMQHLRKSPFADYYTFQQQLQGIDIQDAILKVIIPHNGDRVKISGYYFNTTHCAQASIPDPAMSVMIHPTAASFPIPAGTPLIPVYLIEEDKPVLYYTQDHQFAQDRSRLRITYNNSGEVIKQENFRTYFSASDTVVRAKVFLPDPITTAETDYAGDYKDFSDADNDALNNERFEVELPAQFESGVFYLRTDSILLKDLNTPAIAIATALTDTLYFTRSEDGFEDVNTLYHLTEMVNYLGTIGYTDLPDFYIEVDPHGASGADQSFYVSAAIPSIQFGEGGVDDAEDADVIIHEYTHALSDHASPGSNTGLERRALDEGYGDYFAVSHSRRYSDYKWEEVFTWDGHNEFWFGRNADTDKHYPEDNSDNYYAASEIWSGALMDIFDLIGKENTDKLVCEALYGSIPNMTMPDAAQLILDAESLLFSGTYAETVFDALDARGLIDPVSISAYSSENGINFSNTIGFAGGAEPIIVNMQAPTTSTWRMYNASGVLIASGSSGASTFGISAPEGYIGMVLIHVSTPHTNASVTAVVLR